MFPYVLDLMIAMSVLGFLLYGWDKRKARKQRRRIPEAWLLSVGFFGGALGALLGMLLLRHKTRHWYFWIVNIAGLLWQGILLLALHQGLIELF